MQVRAGGRDETGQLLQALAGMTGNVDSVKKVSDLIAGIAAASREQSSGVAQVDVALSLHAARRDAVTPAWKEL